MNGLIGNRNDAKFIFLGVDDEKDLPTKPKLTKYFPKGSFNVYKAHGYFSSSFQDIEKFYAIKRNGFSADVSWGMKTCISHGIRIISDESPSSFLALELSASIVDFLDLSHNDMDELKKLIDEWRQLTSSIEAVTNCLNSIDKAKLMLKAINLTDPKIQSPDSSAIATLFDNYGDIAIAQLVGKFNLWHQKVIWR
jgi:hypothetical protein